ncbi:hypothetical protein [Metabacillus litoralis]|uniref:hypothetical protein n=1 Tax=Metabacillus litoralis TaxID=152268 RepID=UPI00203A8BE1|nr:hypothetical protein [Metabacillus litoralis]MCM3160962.1 hypothetical protein [Metabacillus litoralis]
MINIQANTNGTKKFYIGTSITFDISIEANCENNQSAIAEGLRKLHEYAIAIPELTLTLHDGTVVKPTIHNYTSDEMVAIDENE